MSRGIPDHPEGQERNKLLGLTLVELLIVLFIVSLGWFTLLPRLDPTGPAKGSEPLIEINAFLDHIRHAAVQTGRFQVIRLDLASGGMTWNEASRGLPQPVTHCTLNGSPCPRPVTHLRIYPQGHMDRLQLHFADRGQWTTADLDARLIPANPGRGH